MFVAHRLRASSFICSFSFRFHTPDHIRCYGECMTSCSPTSVTVSAVLITMMHYLLRSLGFSRCPQHGLAISAQLLLSCCSCCVFCIIVDEVAMYFPKGKIRCQGVVLQSMIHVHVAYWQLQELELLFEWKILLFLQAPETDVWVKVIPPVYACPLKLLLYNSPPAGLIHCVYNTLSRQPASSFAASNGNCWFVFQNNWQALFNLNNWRLFSNMNINNLLCAVKESLCDLFLHCFVLQPVWSRSM